MKPYPFEITSDQMIYAENLFALLDNNWTEGQGMNRPAYMAEGENRAINDLIKEGRKLGLSIRTDAAGNVFMIYPGKNPDAGALLTGSHVDSVVNGGRYDGPAGVIAGLTVVHALMAQGITPDQDFIVGIYRNEESPSFKQVSVGMKLASGSLDPAEFMERRHTHTGHAFRKHLQASGLDPERLIDIFKRHGELIPFSSIAAQIEIHIEQERELSDQDTPLGIVTAIRGNYRLPGVTIKGQTGHSGAKSFEKRQDAGMAKNRLVSELYDEALRLRQSGRDIVFTEPYSRSGDSAKLTHIPDDAQCALEVRSTEDSVLKDFLSAIHRVSDDLQHQHNVMIDLGNIVYSAPATMSQTVIDAIGHAAQQIHIKTMLMPSGAGHDSAEFAKKVDTGMIFIAQKTGLSHRHEEDMGRDPDKTFSCEGDFAKAITLLGQIVVNGLNQNARPGSFVKKFDEMYAPTGI
ncbi:MAG: hydantoinase/carbamoylase family amidase [Alphaproteobacteria bacterium]|nr:hydantoinase/carbamoylase family amidase [Alphaproteobacteria bacterium]